MRLVVLEYLSLLRESGEFDALLPDLLLAMDIVPISKPQIGVRQAGVDLAAVGKDEDDAKTLWLFVLKRGDIGRREWDSGPQAVRQSLDEIKDVYLRANVLAEHAGLPTKIVVATTGSLKQEIEQQWAGYTATNSQAGRGYSFWGGDRIAALIEQHLLNEYALPSEARSELRRALALVGEPDYELDHFYDLLKILLDQGAPASNGDGKRGERNLLRALRTVNLALGILCRWAAQDDNLKSAVIACERALLWSWDAIRRHEVSGRPGVMTSYARIIGTYLNITTEYYNKVQAHLHTSDALASYYRESALLTERVFEEIGLLASIGLSHLLWGITWRDEQRKEGAKTVATSLAAFLQTHTASGSPCYDGQIVDIVLALELFLLTEQGDAMEAWLNELSGRLSFGFRLGRWFPLSTDSFDDLVSLEVDRDSVDMRKLKETSWTVPILAQWMAALKLADAYENLAKLRLDVLKETHFQIWYPDKETDTHLYRGPAHHETGITEAPAPIPPTFKEMRTMVARARSDSPIKDAITSSAAKTGLGWLDLIASRHFRTPPDPAFWQDFLIASGAPTAP